MSTLHIHTKFYSQLTPTWHSRFPSSTLTAGMQPWIRVRVELFTRPFLPSPLSPRPHRKGLGTKLASKVNILILYNYTKLDKFYTTPTMYQSIVFSPPVYTSLIGASLSEPHTCVTALLDACVCLRVAIYRKFKLSERASKLASFPGPARSSLALAVRNSRRGWIRTASDERAGPGSDFFFGGGGPSSHVS